MTESEAIEKLNMLNDALNWQRADADECSEALQMAIKALEKQIAKKPKKSGVTDKRGIFHPINGIDGVPYDLCPLCEANLCTTGILGRKKMNYCKECGQKLDWSDE